MHQLHFYFNHDCNLSIVYILTETELPQFVYFNVFYLFLYNYQLFLLVVSLNFVCLIGRFNMTEED